MSSDEAPAGHASDPSSVPLRIMTLRRPDRCSCGTELDAGARAGWHPDTRTVRCLPCVAALTRTEPIDRPLVVRTGPRAGTEPPRPADSSPIELGAPGGSAQAEFERRQAHREARLRASHPRIGGVLAALTAEPQTTRAWRSGAVGERRLADRLSELGDSVVALHDRRAPGTRANIDHVVIGSAAVYVVDAKHYKNAKITVRRSGGLLSPVREQLMVAGRDRTALAHAMQWQLTAVRTALDSSSELADVPIVAALCFIDADFPLFGTLSVGDVRVNGLRGTAKLVVTRGPLGSSARNRIARHLATHLPAKRPQ